MSFPVSPAFKPINTKPSHSCQPSHACCTHFLSSLIFTHTVGFILNISGADLTLSSTCFLLLSPTLSPSFLPPASPLFLFGFPLPSYVPFSPFPDLHDHLLSSSSSSCLSSCCTRLRGVITPPTAPGPT